MNHITHLNISLLKAEELTELLYMLLHLEYKKYLFPDCYISVPQNITTADGGEDGRLQTSDYKDSRWVVDRLSIFQSKATNMTDADCKNEVLQKKKKGEPYKLKLKIKEVLDKAGTYVLFTTSTLVEGAKDQTSARVKAIREGIELAEGKEYAESAKIFIYDSNLISNWTNEFISAVSFVQSCQNITRPHGILIWKDWKTYQENSTNYKDNEEIRSIITLIRDKVFNKVNMRIEGVSGIGKTRLLCEAFSPGETDSDGNFDQKRKSLSDSVVYFDLATGKTNEILDFVRSSRHLSATLVLDNCEPNSHEVFLREVQRTGSLQNIVSIDYEKLQNRLVDSEIISLESRTFNTVVEDILKEKYNQVLSNHDIKYLAEFSEGNPKMAIQFVKASLQNLNLNETLNNDLIEKLIFGRNSINDEEFKILKIFSAFKYIEFPDDSYYSLDPDHYETLQEHAKFFADFFNINFESLRLAIKKYEKRGVIERRGHKLVIRPNPLSLKLCLIFWDELLSPEKYSSFLDKCPATLRNSLVEQLAQLGEVGRAKDLVKEAWGINGNFSTAEILNSNFGSRLFRSVVSVNPLETVKVLENHYLDKPKEYLLEVKEGRQNLVWALEKLCFREETFDSAAKVLMCFAMAENEFNYSNNASDYFTQLFRIYLAGTEVGYGPRIKILEWAARKNNKDFNSIILKACERSLTPTAHLSKIMGAEQQGGLKLLNDYQPKSAEEINSYRESILNILLDFAIHESDIQMASQKVIYTNIADLFEFDFSLDKLRLILDNVVDHVNSRHDFIKHLYSAASLIQLNKSQQTFILGYIDKLKTNTIDERILNNVSEPQLIFRSLEDEENYDQKRIEMARKFADEIVNENINLVPFLPNLLTGTQYSGFDFGKRIGELNGYKNDFIVSMIDYIDSLESTQHDLSFALGYFSSFSEKQIHEVFDFLLGRKSLLAVNLFNYLTPNLNDVKRLAELIINKDISIERLTFIKRQIILLKDEEIIEYFTILEKHNRGIDVISDTLFTIVWTLERDNSKNVSDEILQYLKSFVTRYNLLNEINFSNSMDYYEWEMLMKKLLSRFNTEVTTIIAKNIIEHFDVHFSFTRKDSHIATIANEILNIDFDNCWSLFANLLDKKAMIFWQIFDMGYISDTSAKHPFFVNDERNEKLLRWLEVHSAEASNIVRVSPLFDYKSSQWFPFTKKLIKQFGDDDRFLSELSSNLFSMFTSGSRVPYLTARKNLLEEFKNDDIERIRNWAKKELDYYEKQIALEQIEDADGFLGQ